MRNRTPISPSLLRSVFRGVRSAVVRGLLSAACCAGLAGSAAAQVDVFPSSVDIRLLQGPNPDQLRIQLKIHGTADFGGILSAVTATIRYDAASGSALGAGTSFCNAWSAFTPSPVVVSNGVAYRTYNGFGLNRLENAPGDGGCGTVLVPEEWFTLTTIDVSGSGCTAFTLGNDAWTGQHNRDYFISMGGVAVTGQVTGGPVNAGNCGADCLGVAGGTALPGTPCDDGNSGTVNDAWTANCECVGTACDVPVVAVAENNSPICSTASLSLGVTATGTPPFSYAWSGAGNFSPDQASPTVAVAQAATGNYQVTVSNACGSASLVIPVTVEPQAAAAIAYNGSPYCSADGPAAVAFTGTGGGTFSATPAGLALDAGNGTINVANSAPGSYTVTYTVAASGACAAFSTTAPVAITQAPSASIAYAGSPYCSSAGSIAVQRTGTGGGGYASSPAGLALNANTGTINATNSAPGSYTVTYTIAASGGCAAFSTAAQVAITQAPSASIAYAGSPYCSSAGSIAVQRTGTGGGGYASSPAGLALNANTGAINAANSAPGSYTVTYTVAASGGCAAFSTAAPVAITQAPSASIAYAGSPYCSSAGSIAVQRTGTGGGGYASSPAGLALNANTGAINAANSAPGSYTVTYTVAASGGCAAFSTTAPVAITQAPSASIAYAGSPFCTTQGARNVTRTGTGGGTFTANPAGLALNAGNGTVHPAISSAGTYTVTYTVAAAGGCPAFATTAPVTIVAATTWYADADNDGAGDDADTLVACAQPAGYVASGGDLCPGDPAKTAPGACGCGVPETNIDGDSAPDCIDGCPTDPDKTAPGVCGCGIPDTDSDADGLADCVDNCPNLPGVVGDACDDGDPGTEGDVITANCTCAGITAGIPDRTGSGGTALVLYPNPNSGGEVFLDLSGLRPGDAVRIDVLDLTGRSVARDHAVATSGTLHHAVHLGPAVARGAYLVQVRAGELRLLGRLVVE